MTQVIELMRQTDGDGIYLHFTGGFRAAKVAKGLWRIEPILINEKPCATGPMTTAQLKALAKQNDFLAVALHEFGWINGVYYSSLSPVVSEKTNDSPSPAELWSNIAGNISRSRTKDFFEATEHPAKEEITKTLDEKEPVEALARYISLSLRSMDISVEHIAQHYHEQLVNHMAAGQVYGEKSANTLSHTLYAHVHSFFLHLGAARDYLGALIAYRVGFDYQQIDSMARLVGKLRKASLPNDALLDLLFADGDIIAHPEKLGKFAVAGWMQEVTSIRNELVHERPYGSRFSERLGWATPSQKEAGLFRYFRPLEINGNAENDVFDVLHHHYARCARFMHKAAKVSESDTSMMHITDEDIVSQNVREPGGTKN